MPIFAFYLLKVVLCSAVLFGYYYFFLRNKVYHAYNRFYLLATVVIALLAPVINFKYLFMGGATPAKSIQLLQVVTSSDEYLEEVILYSHRNFISLSQVLLMLYSIVSFILLFAIVKVILHIVHLLKTNSSKYINDVVFVDSNAKGTPFSFFKFIFWNNAIDLHSATGQQIFAHELAHVREKHSVDKLFLNIVLIVCWINPIFWLIKKELNLIHEFIADKKAVANNDAAALAAMIVTSAYPKHAYLLTNHFFYSPIKRRLLMLSKYNTNKAGYFYRILALPVVLFFVAAFTIKTKAGIEKLVNPAKKITVVIDAGHGGKDAGALTLDGSHEKDITLAFIKRIKDLNQSSNIELVFTRETDIYQSPQEKAAIAKKNGADLFISIHAASEPFSTATKNGMEVYVSKDENLNSKASKLFASSVIANFKNNYGIAVSPLPIQRNIGIFVLQANECPSILIETGYVSNRQDLAYLQSSKAKDDFAKILLQAIAQYADNLKSQDYATATMSSKEDTVPSTKNKLGLYKGEEIKSISVLKDGEVVKLKLANGKTVSMSMDEAKKQHIVLPPPPPPAPPVPAMQAMAPIPALPPLAPVTAENSLPALPPIPPVAPPPPPPPPKKRSNAGSNNNINGQYDALSLNNNIKGNFSGGLPISMQPLCIVDGQVFPYSEIKNINPESIKEVNILKDKAATAKYGVQGSINGVIEINTKLATNRYTNYNISGNINLDTLIQEPEFPGGKDEWAKYLRNNLDANSPVDEGWSAGTFRVIIKFIVAKDGSVSDVVAENYADSKTAKMCVDFIKNGPKWIPGKQNNKIVRTYKKQPITFVIQEQ